MIRKLKRNKNIRKNKNSTNKIQKINKFIILFSIIISNNLLSSKNNSKINFQKLIPSYLFKTKFKLNPDEIIYMGERKLIKDVINSYLSLIGDKYKSAKDIEAQKLYNYSLLKSLSEEPILLNDIRNSLLKAISGMAHKNLSQVNTIFLTENMNFGNALVCLNNLIFYCEIIGCKNITLNRNNRDRKNWYIKDPIISENPKLTIQLGDRIDCNENSTACIPLGNFFFPLVTKVQLRVNVVKDEILRNLPKIVTDPNDLYIHFRTGNIFRDIFEFYAQPPFCFYDKIIKNNKFNKIYIIAEDDSNKIIAELMNKYPTIIYKPNNVDIDIAYLSHAYNIVGSTSSFLCSIIKLNDNLKYLWEYDIYRETEKIYHLHYHFFNFQNTFTIYSMKPNDTYRNELFVFRHSEEQIKLMFEDKCPYDFIIFQSKYDIS